MKNTIYLVKNQNFEIKKKYLNLQSNFKNLKHGK